MGRRCYIRRAGRPPGPLPRHRRNPRDVAKELLGRSRLEVPSQLELDPWPALRAELRRSVGHTVYEIWLAGLRPLGWDGSVLELAAPAETCAWVRRRCGRMLEECGSPPLGPA